MSDYYDPTDSYLAYVTEQQLVDAGRPDLTAAQKRLDKRYAKYGKRVKRDTLCENCGRRFHRLGIMSHRAACLR